MCRELQIFAFVFMYLDAGQVSLDFVIETLELLPIDDITIGFTCAAFCFHIAHISFSSSWYLFRLSVIVLARLCVFGTAMSIKKVVFVFLFMRFMSDRLSIIMLRFQYSMKLSLSSTLAGVYR